jgi:hypothetical protein
VNSAQSLGYPTFANPTSRQECAIYAHRRHQLERCRSRRRVTVSGSHSLYRSAIHFAAVLYRAILANFTRDEPGRDSGNTINTFSLLEAQVTISARLECQCEVCAPP